MPGRGPSRRRGRRPVVIGLSVLIAALSIFALQQTGDGDGPAPLNAIAEAAERTQQMPGGRSILHGVLTSPDGSESFKMTGETVYNDGTDRSRGVIRVLRPEPDGPVVMQMVTDGTVMYMRSDLFGSLPDGREWMAIDLSLGGEVELPLPSNSDATGELEILEEVTGDIQKVGKEDVRGVPTTRYRGTAEVSDQVENLREKGADDLASYVEEEAGPARVEAWIDGKGLVRRTRIVQLQPRENGAVTVDMRMDFVDFGFVPDIDVPDPDEVFDATASVQDEIARSADE